MRRNKIAIFEGRAAKYNRAILKALLTNGPSTSWQIAKQIQREQNPMTNNDAKYGRTQKIYSVLARKGGALDRLAGKGYISEEKGSWNLLFPKSTVILIEKPNLTHEINPYYTSKVVREIRDHFQSIKTPKKIKGPFGLRVRVDPIRFKASVSRFLDAIPIEEMMQVMAKKTVELQKEGIDLDVIENKELAFIVLTRMQGWFKSKAAFEA